MGVDIITPTDHQHWLDLRKLDVTSTESAALFGMSPYITQFELWHAKKSGTERVFEVNERMKWGNRLEAAIAAGLAEEHGWEIKPLKDYMRVPELRIGSSFDFVITNLGEPVHLEIKNVDYLAFRDGWIEHDDGSIEAPEHIEMQVQHQMAVSGYKRAFIGVFVAGNRGEIIERERDEPVIEAIKKRVADFWRSIDLNEEPSPVMPDDAAAVIRMNQYAKPESVRDVGDDEVFASMVSDYKIAAGLEQKAKEQKETAKARLLSAIGETETVLLDNWKISASMQAPIPPTVITADMVGQTYGGRAGFRNLRINPRKSK